MGPRFAGPRQGLAGERSPAPPRLGRRDIATEAAIFIAEAERVIVQANPPKAEGGPGRGIKTVAPDDSFIPPSTLRDMRQAHAGLTDDGFKALYQPVYSDPGSPVNRYGTNTLRSGPFGMVSKLPPILPR